MSLWWLAILHSWPLSTFLLTIFIILLSFMMKTFLVFSLSNFSFRCLSWKTSLLDYDVFYYTFSLFSLSLSISLFSHFFLFFPHFSLFLSLFFLLYPTLFSLTILSFFHFIKIGGHDYQLFVFCSFKFSIISNFFRC
jgi:hypothetical protein